MAFEAKVGGVDVARLPLVVDLGKERRAEDGEEAVEDGVAEEDAEVAATFREAEAQRLEELVADRVLAVCVRREVNQPRHKGRGKLQGETHTGSCSSHPGWRGTLRPPRRTAEATPSTSGPRAAERCGTPSRGTMRTRHTRRSARAPTQGGERAPHRNAEVVQLVRDETGDEPGQRVEPVEPGSEEARHVRSRDGDAAEQREDDEQERVDGSCRVDRRRERCDGLCDCQERRISDEANVKGREQQKQEEREGQQPAEFSR